MREAALFIVVEEENVDEDVTVDVEEDAIEFDIDEPNDIVLVVVGDKEEDSTEEGRNLT